jgi:hypothetical protein
LCRPDGAAPVVSSGRGDTGCVVRTGAEVDRAEVDTAAEEEVEHAQHRARGGGRQAEVDRRRLTGGGIQAEVDRRRSTGGRHD